MNSRREVILSSLVICGEGSNGKNGATARARARATAFERIGQINSLDQWMTAERLGRIKLLGLVGQTA
jgi:hypothetical protein